MRAGFREVRKDIDLYTSENFILASPVAGGDSSFGNGVFSGEPFVKLPGALGKHRWRTALQLFAEMPGGIGVVELAFFQQKSDEIARESWHFWMFWHLGGIHFVWILYGCCWLVSK